MTRVIMLRFPDEVSWKEMQVYINGRVRREGEADLWASCGIVVNPQMVSRRVGCKVVIENQADIPKGIESCYAQLKDLFVVRHAPSPFFPRPDRIIQ